MTKIAGSISGSTPKCHGSANWSQDNTGEEEDGDEGDGDDGEEEVDGEEEDDTECTCGSCTDDPNVPKKCCNTSPCLSTTAQGMLIPHSIFCLPILLVGTGTIGTYLFSIIFFFINSVVTFVKLLLIILTNLCFVNIFRRSLLC